MERALALHRGKTSTRLSWGASGHVAQEFDCPSQQAFWDIYPLHQNGNHWILKVVARYKPRGFGYGLSEIGCLQIKRSFASREFCLSPMEHNRTSTWENMTSEKIRFLWPRCFKQNWRSVCKVNFSVWILNGLSHCAFPFDCLDESVPRVKMYLFVVSLVKRKHMVFKRNQGQFYVSTVRGLVFLALYPK